jgi:dienelactone hydrolase
MKVGLVNLGSGAKVEFEGMRRFAFSGESATHLALLKVPATAPQATATTSTPPTPRPQPAARPERREAGPQRAGSDLILHELATGRDLTLGNVGDFAFDKKGLWLALVIATRDQAGNGVQLRNMKTAALHQLEGGKANYEQLGWTEKGDAFTVLRGVEDKDAKAKRYSVLGFTDLGATPRTIVYDPRNDPSFPAGMTISPNRKPYFADDLDAIFFGIHALARDSSRPADGTRSKGRRGKRSETLAAPPAGKAGAGKDKPELVIWHWRDDRLQPMQQVQARLDRLFSYLAVYRVKERKFLRLSDDTLRNVRIGPKQRWATGLDNRAYRRRGTLDGRYYHDVYAIDLHTGKRRLALKQNRWEFGVSPDGKTLLYYDDGHFRTHDLATGKNVCLTAGAPVPFSNVEDDHNIDRPPTFPVGWAKDGSAVLLSDGWDVWKFPAAGGPGVNLTGHARKDGIRYRRRLVLDPEEKGIDLSAPVYFWVYGEWTKKSGFARLEPGQSAPVRLCWGDAEVGSLLKARHADVFVYTRQTYREFPDYHASDATFKAARKLTDINPQQPKFLWASGVRLLDYAPRLPATEVGPGLKSNRLQATLLLPAGYQKGKSYPTIVYIYERLSQRMHSYPQPTVNGFNPALYTSNGYAVLMPDISYKVNDPGRSAVWCVLPALEAAIATGVVDRTRVGLHGHSWGGYQTSFLITQTGAFKAAVAGAPLTNLVSMYSSVYWNTGSANQPIFESSQGRFTSGYWDNLDAYLRNSPVHHARKVKTPLLLLHNDKDGAVDWTQGIEYFNTLRRLDKPVVMLQYKGENHGLARPANQKDYTVRMREFFDHHLLGKPAPAWLREGVPHLKMDEHLQERHK